MYDRNIEFEEKVTRLVDENDKELKKVNELLDLALKKLEINRKELENELLKDEEEKKIDELVKIMSDEYDNMPCMDIDCSQCEYRSSESCAIKFVIKKLIKSGMLEL